jgi:hypothetical protein
MRVSHRRQYARLVRMLLKGNYPEWAFSPAETSEILDCLRKLEEGYIDFWLLAERVTKLSIPINTYENYEYNGRL